MPDYVSRPEKVEAFQIWRVHGEGANRTRTLILQNVEGVRNLGHQYTCEWDQLVGYTPINGDYLVFPPNEGRPFVLPNDEFVRRFKEVKGDA